MLKLRLAQHLHQVAHLAARPQPLRTHHQPNRALRKLRPQSFNLRDRRVIDRTHPKQNLKPSPEFLPAMTHKSVIHPLIDTLHRLQNRNIRRKLPSCNLPPPLPIMSKVPRSPKRNQQIRQPTQRQHHKKNLNPNRNPSGHPTSLPNPPCTWYLVPRTWQLALLTYLSASIGFRFAAFHAG